MRFVFGVVGDVLLIVGGGVVGVKEEIVDEYMNYFVVI